MCIFVSSLKEYFYSYFFHKIFDFFNFLQFLALFCININDAKPSLPSKSVIDNMNLPKMNDSQVKSMMEVAEKYNIQTKEQGCEIFKKKPHLCPSNLVDIVTMICGKSVN